VLSRSKLAVPPRAMHAPLKARAMHAPLKARAMHAPLKARARRAMEPKCSSKIVHHRMS
jgi:hypothetical protein